MLIADQSTALKFRQRVWRRARQQCRIGQLSPVERCFRQNRRSPIQASQGSLPIWYGLQL
ncbi:hypothetical protein B6S44_02560 [Bosea sp. Tri-44]|nr:hypothetical protein B6S44_02560 [Bosea sp. Tri-44]